MTVKSETIVFAHRLADASGAAIRPHFRRHIDVTDKGSARSGFDPVTAADREAERAMRAIIERERPEDGILGEEFGEKPSRNGLRWVLDPVDGTRAFIAGQPMWGSLIALERDGKPVIGIIEQPFLRERFIGTRGRAEMRVHGEAAAPLCTRACSFLAEAIVCTTHPFAHMDDSERISFRRVETAARMSRYGGDCYAYALLAMGFVDLVMEAGLAHWDIAAILPIVEGAGGVITDWRGGPCENGGQVLAAGDARIHRAAMEMLAG